MQDTEYVFKPISNKQELKKLSRFYTISGEHDYYDDKNLPRLKTECSKVLAKSVETDGDQERYFIKVGKDGKFIDPTQSINPTTPQSSFLNTICRESKFKAVNVGVFNMYLSFLQTQTKNVSWLYNASRGAE